MPFPGARKQETRTFSLDLPRGPCSFSGKLVSLIWALELVLQPSGEAGRTRITIGPQGREVNLVRPVT